MQVITVFDITDVWFYICINHNKHMPMDIRIIVTSITHVKQPAKY